MELGLAATAWAAAPIERSSAPASPTAAPDAPTTVGIACFSNSCGGARDPAAIAAAIKAGDGKAVLAAGGQAGDLLAAWMTQLDGRMGAVMETSGRSTDFSAAALRNQLSPGSEKFATMGSGYIGVHYDLVGGGSETLSFPDTFGVAPAPGTPSSFQLDGGPSGPEGFVAPPGAIVISAPIPNRSDARQVLGYYAPPPH